MTERKWSLRLNKQNNTSYTSPDTGYTDTTSSPNNTGTVTQITKQEDFRTTTQGQSQSTSAAQIDTSSPQRTVESNTNISQHLYVDSDLGSHKGSYQDSNNDSQKDSHLRLKSDQDSHPDAHEDSHVNSHVNSYKDSHRNPQLDSHFETDNRTDSSVKTDVISPHATEINVPKSSQYKNTQDESESSREFLVTYSVEDGKSGGNLAEKELTGYREGMLRNGRNRKFKRQFGRNGPFFRSKYFYQMTSYHIFFAF